MLICNHSVYRIHFIGIGGSGMCGIASILACKGYYITGSDITNSDIIQNLMKLGIKVYFGHQGSNVNKAHLIVVSSAIDCNNPEIKKARLLRIPIMKRAEMLFELMLYKYSIAITGTHGKTTTTAMIINICIEAGLDPTFINGGALKLENLNACLGYSDYLIIEADESDRSFLFLYPTAAIITNIDNDHMNTYKSITCLKESFFTFLNNVPPYGYIVACIDNIFVREILFNINREIITYGFSKDSDLCIANFCSNTEKNDFTILLKDKRELQVILRYLPGRHNILNATAAIAVAMKEGIHDKYILKAIYDFQGVNRRFENLGYYSLLYINGNVGKIMMIDDYGHHPSELRVSISTVRFKWPNKRLIMIFQPHRFTRTQELYNNFIDILSTTDVLLVLNIYSSGEQPIVGIDSVSLCQSILKYGKIKPIFIANTYILWKTLIELLQDNDLILIQGAGTISSIMRNLFKKFLKNCSNTDSF